ncbi:DUF349 domain-containing protein [uncultured Clostridium sp.]|jgi:hypothetical protein|uniref:DUF349 domain-containing protein n=1 Tax=uncultured Clostridium sp. TaxID=59620 RepID=UPI002628F453|nr:DUF349 domain-containing protein [uncultured Clostridium sp.]
MKIKEFKKYIKQNGQSLNNAFATELDEFDKENVVKRREIIEQIIVLANTSENWKEANKKFYELLEEFKVTPCSDTTELPKLNDEMNKARKAFYDKRQEFYDKAEDRFKANAVQKEEILANLGEIHYAADAIKNTDEIINKITERFFELKFAGAKQQTLYKAFNDLRDVLREERKVAVESLKETYIEKRIQKKVLIEELSSLTENENWKDATTRFNELTEIFKTIGFSGKEENDEISAAYKAAKDNFFQTRQVFFDEMKAGYSANIEKRKELTEKVKELYVNENWKNASAIIKEISEEFFKVGFCGSDSNETIVNEFKEVRDGFYALRQEYFDEIKSSRNDKQLDFLTTLGKNKEDFIVKLRGFISNDSGKLEEFKERLFSVRPSDKSEEIIGNYQTIIEDIQGRVASNKDKLKVVQDELFQVKKQISELK